MLTQLDVPYFKQTTIGSCGPACLMMVLKYHRPEVKVNRILEFRAWMHAQLFPLGMTDAFGLAEFAATRRFGALVIKEEKRFNVSFDYGYISWFFTIFMLPVLRFNYDRIRTNALSRGVTEFYEKVDIDTIERFVQDKKPPIVMVDQTGYAPDDDYQNGMLHWVVVTGFDSETVKINDPDLGPLAVPKVDFVKALDLLRRNFETDRRIVVIDSEEGS
ncbi:MAG: peptidase C39 family protein [Nitrososphaerales archaeon]